MPCMLVTYYHLVKPQTMEVRGADLLLVTPAVAVMYKKTQNLLNKLGSLMQGCPDKLASDHITKSLSGQLQATRLKLLMNNLFILPTHSFSQLSFGH